MLAACLTCLGWSVQLMLAACPTCLGWSLLLCVLSLSVFCCLLLSLPVFLCLFCLLNPIMFCRPLCVSTPMLWYPSFFLVTRGSCTGARPGGVSGGPPSLAGSPTGSCCPSAFALGTEVNDAESHLLHLPSKGLLGLPQDAFSKTFNMSQTWTWCRMLASGHLRFTNM